MESPISAEATPPQEPAARAGVEEGVGLFKTVLAKLRPFDSSPPPAPEVESLLQAVRTAHPKADTRVIRRAYALSEDAHHGQMRMSGETFLAHPLGVAKIVAELGMDEVTVVAALLHDTVEDTGISLSEVDREFGPEVGKIIDGLTKLDRLKFATREAAQAESMRKMVIAMARDIRVLVIKLADRLDNMRTIGYLDRTKQERKARETLEIYAPLAHRLGINQVRWELEDQAFAVLYPKRYEEIVRMVTEHQPEREACLRRAIDAVTERLAAVKVRAEVTGRPKHYYSVYEKMVARGKDFNEMFDLVGVRVVVDTVRDCYAALGTVHALWKPFPGRFKDYIAMPKFNMYQSLHTTVVGPEGKPLEVQIRTQAMHRTSEFGVAAHWKYKERGQAKAGGEQELAWLRQILDWQRESSDPSDFMEGLKVDLYLDEVFVFTPKGEVVPLPQGATPVDFAYGIHTEVGHRCVGARVNDRLVPLDYHLQSGDTVSVLTSKSETAGPSRDWLTTVRTPRARNKIRQWFQRERREDAIETGRESLVRSLRKQKHPLQRILASDVIERVSAEMRFANLEAFYAAIGEGHVSAASAASKIAETFAGAGEKQEEPEEILERPARQLRLSPHLPPAAQGIAVQGASDVLVKLAKCCTPVPGDPILGFVTRGRGVSVHRTDCPNAKDLSAEADRLIEVSWDSSVGSRFAVSIQVEALDRGKLLRDITTVLSDHHVNILQANVSIGRDRVATLRFTFELGDVAHLAHVLADVKKVDAVFDAYRVVPSAARNRK